MDIEKKVEHEDLEEKFQLAAGVEFQSNSADFEGLQSMKIEIKKKKEKKTIIENVRLKQPKRGLF
jgi:hypothetical protein